MHESELFCRIETPKGAFVAQRAPLERWMPSPGDCCYFPDTVDSMGRPLQAIVCTSQPGAPGEQISVKPVALLRVRGSRGREDVVLCVAMNDPSWQSTERAQDLPARLRDDIQQFLSACTAGGGVGPSLAWCSRDDAGAAIDDAAARWAATINGHG
ncbi:MAG TPA: inorganic diphosphatase [Solirubrobacteraceae bacterium]|nr:inorganic diphosphatase [Solirubrobacteraceae bacterium]